MKILNLKNIYIQPAAGDNGLAVGAAYLGYLNYTKKKSFIRKKINHSYFGPEYNDKNI